MTTSSRVAAGKEYATYTPTAPAITDAGRRRFLVTGAASGAFSALVFTALHDLIISDIWSSLMIMMVAGALCGAAIASTYGMLFARPTVAGWIGYNQVYVAALIAMGLVSLALYEPITTAQAVIASNRAPTELMRSATPLSLSFIVATAAIIHLRWGRGAFQFFALLATSALTIVLLGLNVSVLGLVQFDSSGWRLVLFMYALVLVLNFVFVGAFAAIERRALRASGHSDE